MDPSEFPLGQQVQCNICNQLTPSYEIVNYGSIEQGYRELCGRCFNAEMAKLDGLEGFENLKFEPVVVADCAGELHEFHFRTHLFGTGVALDAFEIRGGSPVGYQFQIIGNPEDDQLVLLGQLIEKIRQALAIKYLTQSEHGLEIAEHHQAVRGRIEWDDVHDGRLPLLIIDGRDISWDEFGRMLMTFEGWQFQLNIRDKSEE